MIISKFARKLEAKMTRVTCQSCGHSEVVADSLSDWAAAEHNKECSGTVLFFFQ